MSTKITTINQKDAVSAVQGAKYKNQSVEDFFFITDGTKNTMTGLPFPLKKMVADHIGNRKATIIVWRS